MANSNPTRRRRRMVLTIVAAIVVAIVGTVAALPWLLATPPGRRWLLARADRALAPGSVHFDTLRLSWFGPTRMSGFVLRDAQGDRVVVARSANWDRNLRQILFDRPRFGTLRLSGGQLDLERLPDGSIDLYETIKPLIRHDPRTDLSIYLSDGTLRLRGAGLAQPVTAQQAEVFIHVASAPGPVSWQVRLSQGANGTERLQVAGSYDRWRVRPELLPDLLLVISGHRWPFALSLKDVGAHGRWEGQAEVRRVRNLWSSKGTAALLDLDIAGEALAGDHLRLDRAGGDFDLAQTQDAWVIRKLDLRSSIGSLEAEGTLPAATGTTARVVGELDLAALARQIPHALRLRDEVKLERGAARLVAEARGEAGRQLWDLSARISDLVASKKKQQFTLHDPATLSARLVRQGSELKVERAGLKTAFLDLSAEGSLDQGINLKGSLDLAGLERQAHDLVELGDVSMAGRGEITGRYQRTGSKFAGSSRVDLHNLKLAGLPTGTLAREAMRVDASVKGPADDWGLPGDWSTARLGLESEGLTAALEAADQGTATHLSASAAAQVAWSDHAATLAASLTGKWDAHVLTVDALGMRLEPGNSGRPGKPEPLAFSARGRYDRASGQLSLEPWPERPPGAVAPVALAPDGVQITGLGSGQRLRAEGGFVGDLAALDRLIAAWRDSQPAGCAGSWSGRWLVQQGDDGLEFGSQLDLRDLSWPASGAEGRHREGLIALAARGQLPRQGDRLVLTELSLASHYAALEASGSLDDLGGRNLIDLTGRLKPDWDALNALLHDEVEAEAQIAGQPRGFRVKGALAADSLQQTLDQLDAEFGFDLVKADFYGMQVGATPVVLRTKKGRLVFDPIRTSLNHGRLRLDPSLDVDSTQGITLTLAPGSVIEDAEVNPEVSQRVLSYVAPVLEEATRASGLVSMTVDRAEFPITGNPDRHALVDGQVVFRNVEFGPGPLADDLLRLIGRTDEPALKLDQPVLLTIADRRVTSHGLALPVGRLTRIELEGAVDFDRNLDLAASLPITPALLGNNPILSDIAAGTRVSVPIRGTLSRPRVDREALAAALKDLGKTLLERSAVTGAAALLERLTRPRDPNAPPPLTKEERRARRQERKLQRQRERQAPREP